ncbi:MAG: FAD-dependent oxidoreductase, partial [Alphaproteobacteria bacterium]|nr:FAD-dependent oxidoreductase [Alphaproteobacteria bacterium]
MAERDLDVVVLGAGIVGLGVALKVQEKGKGVALIDR